MRELNRRGAEAQRKKEKWMRVFRKEKPKLRIGCKQTINTKTLKISILPTIEMYFRPRRRYLPITFWDGRWHFDSIMERDAVLKELKLELCASASLR